MQTVYVVDKETQGMESADWQFAFNRTPRVHERVEEQACKLLNELLFCVLVKKYQLSAVPYATREMAEELCREIEISIVYHSTFQTIKWCYLVLGWDDPRR